MSDGGVIMNLALENKQEKKSSNFHPRPWIDHWLPKPVERSQIEPSLKGDERKEPGSWVHDDKVLWLFLAVAIMQVVKELQGGAPSSF